MDLKGPEMHYFIHNIYDAAVSLGVAGPDLVTHVGDAISIGIALDNIFNKRCSPSQKIVPYQSGGLQAMCGDPKYVHNNFLLLLVAVICRSSPPSYTSIPTQDPTLSVPNQSLGST